MRYYLNENTHHRLFQDTSLHNENETIHHTCQKAKNNANRVKNLLGDLKTDTAERNKSDF